MKQESVRTTVDIPTPLYRQLREQAAAQGCSARELIIRGVEKVLSTARRPARKPVVFPLIRSTGAKVKITNEKIYDHVEFP